MQILEEQEVPPVNPSPSINDDIEPDQNINSSDIKVDEVKKELKPKPAKP